MTDLILTQQADRILTVRIYQTDRKNALIHAMYNGLGDAP